ncbi:hypothetical protein P1X15_19255 [Runella sp. MFBS21]|uniref:hypothetical protein n=1 Tax=Runella sp. MFBS21 TaxID=3034018 RepID=UPI0023F716BA|nr:hypothetical protein [Runella sp. MFBS21]MDF7819767.1 hypothetical protein [Runella sp. MFBS21]
MNRNRELLLASLCILTMAIFNTPLLSIYNYGAFISGIPVFYVFLFGGWLGIILIIAWLVRQPKQDTNDE